MNVYVDALARTLAARGIDVDVFTRRSGRDAEATVVVPGYTVVEVPASGADRAEMVGAFAEGVLKWVAQRDLSYQVIHSHYWLSGWAGVLLQAPLDAPLAISFHTLGRVKEAVRSPGEPRESLMRIAAEAEVVERAECMVASTHAEAADLIELYQADPERICVCPPGVDHDRFSPGDRSTARRLFGLGEGPVVVMVGRVQALKGIDIAIRAVARLPDVTLLVVGGPSGPSGAEDIADLHALADREAPGRVLFHGPMAHSAVVDAYRASDVVVVPSRTESFGLVAVEAQASGVPVVASRVGGLPFVVADGRSGLLVAGHDPADYAAALESILRDPAAAARLASGAVQRAGELSWEATVDRLLELYRGMAR